MYSELYSPTDSIELANEKFIICYKKKKKIRRLLCFQFVRILDFKREKPKLNFGI